MSDYELTERRYGFCWGPADVVRWSSDREHGVWLIINTPRQSLEVRVTRTGLIRVGEVGSSIEGLGDE